MALNTLSSKLVNDYVRSTICRTTCEDFDSLLVVSNCGQRLFSKNGITKYVSREYEFYGDCSIPNPIPRRFCGCKLERKRNNRNVYLQDIEELSQTSWSFHMILKSDVSDIILNKQSQYEVTCICDDCWRMLQNHKNLKLATSETKGLLNEAVKRSKVEVYYEDIFDYFVGTNQLTNQVSEVLEHYHVYGETDWDNIEENEVPQDSLPEHLACEKFRYPITDKNRLVAWIRNDVENPLSLICQGNCTNRLYNVCLDFNVSKPSSPIGFNYWNDWMNRTVNEDSIQVTPPCSPVSSVSTEDLNDIDMNFSFTLQDAFDESISDISYDECPSIDELKLEDYFETENELVDYLTQLYYSDESVTPDYFFEDDVNNC